jgi:sec-independent protein translocase protein TatC
VTIDPRREPGFGDDPERFGRRRLPDDAQPGRDMPFLAHLDELRVVLLHSAVACAAGALGGWMLAPIVLEDVIRRTVKQAVILSPLEAFNERFKLALVLGLVLALPIVLWRVWSFIVPGLLKQERRWILPAMMSSLLLFALGAWAAYGYVVPLVVNVLQGFMTPSMKAEIRLSSLLGFVYNMAIACGLVFQLPLVTMSLTAIGLVTPQFLLKQWRYAIVGAFIVTAVITPGDVVTAQIVMGVPMTLLYFISVGLSFLVAKKKKESEARSLEEE